VNPFVELVQSYVPLFAVLAAIATVLGLAFTIYKAAHERHVKALLAQLHQKDYEISELKRAGHEEFRLVNEQLQEQLAQARTTIEGLQDGQAAAEDPWRSQVSTLREQGDRLRGTVESLTVTLEESREELSERDRADQARARLLKRAMKLEGRLWQRKVLQGAPRFRPLGERHTPVISVLNLKGGVGKTTITAHLGAAFAAKGYRVLLADLDLQGSLSGLFMSESVLVQRSKEKLLLQHFLMNAAESRKVDPLNYCVPIFDGKSAIIPSADSMAYAELNLTMQWLLRLGRRDTRFLLRKGLQQKRLTKRYDIVFLDCPPLFNTCCVNALAASDYILIPVLPSRKAAERVPLLLERVQGLHQVINPELQVMGVLLNRTHSSSLTSWERDLWLEMLDHGQNQWKLPVHAFDTFIRQTTEVRDGEVEFSPPAPGSELFDLFSRLAAEVEARLPGDCRRVAVAPIGPG
jgi:cellulose biosynthesis protein BcsQ